MRFQLAAAIVVLVLAASVSAFHATEAWRLVRKAHDNEGESIIKHGPKTEQGARLTRQKR